MNITSPPRFAPTSLITPPATRRPSKLFNFKFGNTRVSVPYQEYHSGSTRYWMIFYYDAGQRRRETRSTEASARARAEEIAKNMLNGQTAMSQFTQADRASLLRAQELLAPFNISIELAISEWAAIRQQLAAIGSGKLVISDIIRFYIENRPRDFAPRPVPALVAAFLAEKDGQISKDYHAHLANQLGKLATHYTGPLHSLQASDINTWLVGLGVGPRARHNHRAALDQLASWAQRNGYLPRTWSEMQHVTDPGHKVPDIKILTPEQMTALISRRQYAEEYGRAQKTLVPFLALSGFAGIRHEEMNGEKAMLDWRDIHLEERYLYVPKAVAKTGRDRIVPISDNLAAWLTPYARPNGPICSLSQTSGALTKAKRAAAIAAGDNETHNILRHSFISYRKAITKNIAQVAEEAGNSPGIIRKHYLRVIPESEAQRWFTIWPTQAEVLQLNFAGM